METMQESSSIQSHEDGVYPVPAFNVAEPNILHLSRYRLSRYSEEFNKVNQSKHIALIEIKFHVVGGRAVINSVAMK